MKIVLSILIFGMVAQAIGSPLTAATPPNIILILADDLGYGDVGVYGATLIETPHLDRLAGEGVRFTNFYASANVCSPSRAGIMTGRYAIRDGLANKTITATDQRGLPDRATTVASLLKHKGYQTGLVGKWHLDHTSEHWPTTQGFDHYYGLPYSNNQTPLALYRNSTKIEEPVRQATLTERYTAEAIRFIEQNRDQPFFVYLSHTTPHVPLYVPGAFTGKSRGGLRGSKGTPWEGGYRVPFIARWPGNIPAGAIANGISMNIDILPTVQAITGTVLPPGTELDSKNIEELFPGSSDSPHEVLFYFSDERIAALRTRYWKMVVQARYRCIDCRLPEHGVMLLFDIQKDPMERYSVAAHRPDKWRELHTYLERGQRELESLAQHLNTDTTTDML